ncbi:MAG: DEAD/DEAH box helicase [Thermoplasmataceae archaeon]
MTYFLNYNKALESKKAIESMGQKCTLNAVFPEGYNLICVPITQTPKFRELHEHVPSNTLFNFEKIEKKPLLIIETKPEPIHISPIDIDFYMGNLKPQEMTGNYEYQREAVDFALSHHTSLLEIPTGRGKTNIGIGAIAGRKQPTLIVVPTIDLVNQWGSAISSAGGHSTYVGAGKNEFSPLTIITYQSAIRQLSALTQYKTVIFDEVHHLFAPEYLRIFKEIAPTANMIIGLTASARREGTTEAGIQDRLFPERFSRTIAYFQNKENLKIELQLKSYGVTMSEMEKEQYEKYQDVLRNAARKYGNQWMSMVRQGSRMPSNVAREIYGALAAYNKRNALLNELPEKVDIAVKLIKAHPDSIFIVFVDTINMVNYVNETLNDAGVRSVKLHSQIKSLKNSRANIIEDIRSGRAQVLVGAKAIEEGIDLPNLDSAIFMGNVKKDQRGYIQRAGRILRPIAGKQATIYVMYAKDTVEEQNLQMLYGLFGLD